MAEGRKIGNFQLLERLGQGGMGAVFKARQLSMDRIVALKVLPPSLAKQPTFIERFMREARASARLSHPNIVGGIDVGQDGGVYYFAMEYVDGSSAKDLVEKGKLGETQVLKIGKAVAQALAHAHEHGILHRDIKPDNILIDKNGTPKLCDLGLARLDSQTEGEKALTQEGMTLGTPHYISPEQARGQRDLDTKTDLYSLGATLYHLLTGKTMFEGTTNVVVMTKHVTDKCPSPADAGTQASKGMVTVLAKLLAKDRADRYESAEKLVEDFDRVARGKPPLHAELPPAKWPFSGGVPGAPARKPGSTGPVSPVDKGRATRRDAQPEAAAKRVPWLVPAGVLAAIVIVVIVCLGRGGPSAPPPEASPAKAPPPVVAHQDPAPPKAVPSSEDAKRLLEAAEDFATKNPTNVAGALAEFEKVQAAARGTEFAAKAKDAIAALTRRRDEAADAAAKKFVSDADALAAQAKYDSAIAVWEGIPADQVGLLRARAARAIGDLRAQAEAKLKAVMDEVGKCLADKRWADGKKALDAANAVEYRAWNPRLEDLRGKVAAGEQAEAEAARSAIVAAAETAFARYVNAFVSTTLKGDVKGARKIAVEAKADASLKEVAAKSQELSAVCDALEKADAARAAAFETLKDGKERSFETVKGPMKGVVSRVTADEIYVAFKMGGAAGEQPIKLSELTPAERKRLAGDFKPQDPAEHLALAIRALAADDTPSAAAALAAAKDHPLAPPYQAKLDEKQLGAVEAAAKSAWDAIMRAAGTGKLSEKAAKDIGDRVEAFEKDHGKTKRAASIAGEMAALKERLLTAGGGWKAIPPENVRVALKGQATSAVENGALALTAPAGQGNSAVVSLLNFARDFRLRFEFSGDALHMALRGEQFDPGRRVNWQGCIQVFISPDDYNVRIQPVGDAQQPPPWQVLRREARPGLLARGWHTIEISAAARLLTVAFDGVPLCREEHLAAVARGDAFLMVFPAREGRKCAIRNIMIAQLDKETTAGTFEGLLMDNLQGNPFITFKADHEDVSRRYAVPQLPGGGPDLSVLEPLKKVVSLNRLKLSWKLQPDGQPAIVGVQVDRPAANSGVLVGTITFLQGGCVEVLPENGLSERFIPVWRPGPPDRSLMQAVGKSKVGDKVKVTWTYDDRKRMIAIEAAP